MTKKIKWAEKAKKNTPVSQRMIIETENVVHKVERSYTLKQKQEEIDVIKEKIEKLKNRVPKLEAELKKLKSVLKVK